MRRFGRHTAVPGPRGSLPLGIFLRLRRDPLRYLTEVACRYGEVVSLPLGTRRAYLLAHPAHIQHVLQDQADRYRKGPSLARITPLFGEGLTTSEGPLWRRQRRLVQPLFQAYVNRRIAEQSSPGMAGDALLARLLAVRDDATGERMPATQLRDEAVTFWVAGHTTVAAALAWTWYLLAQDPAAEGTLQEELDTILGRRRPTPQDLPHLRYTRLVLEESLRLYPPTWVTARTPAAKDEIGGHVLPAHAVLLLSPYVLQRHPAFWEHPERFDPERFTPERAAGRPRFAYFPFGGGPRRCIGQNLAMLEMLVILAMVAQTYELRLVPGHPVEPDALITLRPRHGILVALRHRHHVR